MLFSTSLLLWNYAKCWLTEDISLNEVNLNVRNLEFLSRFSFVLSPILLCINAQQCHCSKEHAGTSRGS